MSTQFFRLWYRLDGEDRYLVWLSNAEDRVLIDAAGRVPTFSSQAGLTSYVDKLGITLVDEAPILHDLDHLTRWLAGGSVHAVDCDELLAAWNLFDDVARSMGDRFERGDRSAIDTVYEKLFGGSEVANAVLRPKEEPVYQPRWTPEDERVLRTLLGDGLTMFRRVSILVADEDGAG